ncbi:hypothetical protein DJ71_01190, partial [Halorubrum sp. E3]
MVMLSTSSSSATSMIVSAGSPCSRRFDRVDSGLRQPGLDGGDGLWVVLLVPHVFGVDAARLAADLEPLVDVEQHRLD